MVKKLAMLLLAGGLMAAPASAAPNFLGMTGLLNTPTTAVVQDRAWNATFHYITDEAMMAGGSVGIARGLEIGGLWIDPQDNATDSEFTGHVKYQLIPETPKGVSMAIGWWDFPNTTGDMRIGGHGAGSTPYGVLGVNLASMVGHPVSVYAGGGGGFYDGFIAGADVNLSRSLLAMVEFDGDDINAGLRLGLESGFRVDAGYVSTEFGIGASFNSRF